MPELPEVETIRRALEKTIKGKTLDSFSSDWPKKVFPKPPTLNKKIKGQEIVDVKRRAKILIIELKDNLFLIFHLKLTGQIIYQPKKGKRVVGGHPQQDSLVDLPNKYTHHIFTFTDDSKLFFNDLRKFGWVKLVDQKGLDEALKNTGPEPFDAGFVIEKFSAIIKKYPQRTVKKVLLDQSLIAGLGNIYVDETLFDSKIRPVRKSGSLKKAEINLLYKSILKILTNAIKHEGTSVKDYVNANGNKGGYAKYLKVYGRRDQKCKKCDAEIVRIQLEGRGTHYCPKCQG